MNSSKKILLTIFALLSLISFTFAVTTTADAAQKNNKAKVTKKAKQKVKAKKAAQKARAKAKKIAQKKKAAKKAKKKKPVIYKPICAFVYHERFEKIYKTTRAKAPVGASNVRIDNRVATLVDPDNEMWEITQYVALYDKKKNPLNNLNKYAKINYRKNRVIQVTLKYRMNGKNHTQKTSIEMEKGRCAYEYWL